MPAASRFSPPRTTAKTSAFNGQVLLQKYATAATAATFAVVGASGVLVFFHLGEQYLMGVHEWLGLAFVGAAAFHIARHFRPFTTLLSKTRTRALFAATGLVTLAFVAAGALAPSSGGNPMKAFVGAAADAPLAAVAPVVGKSPAALSAELAQAGFEGVTGERTLNEIARAGGQDLPAVFRIVLSGAERAERFAPP